MGNNDQEWGEIARLGGGITRTQLQDIINANAVIRLNRILRVRKDRDHSYTDLNLLTIFSFVEC